MTVAEADAVLAGFQRDGAGSVEVDAAREARDEAVRRAVAREALRRLEREIERCVAEGDAE